MEGAWLVAPLIAKLSCAVQARVLKVAGQKLETGANYWQLGSTEKERHLQKRLDLAI